MNVIDIKKLSKSFGTLQALKDISFAVEQGQVFGFLGPNGAGKSTTIRIIMDFLHATKGTVTILGLDSHVNSVAIKSLIGYVPAEPTLYQDWTVDAHIQFLAAIRGNHITAKANELKETLDLDGKKKVKQLSTGNQQKLAIILALAIEPPLLILDEPTRGLDPLLRSTFHQLLRNYRTNGGTVLLSSHDLAEVEDLCDKVVIIHNGELVQNTTVAQLRSNHGHKVKAQFSQAAPDLSTLVGIENLIIAKHSASFTVTGNLNPVLGVLAEHDVEELEITSASLEDIFEEIYA